MNSAVLQPLTIEEFLEWEDRQEYKHEFDGVGAVAMVGGTAAHSIIQRNLAFQLVGRLAGKPCKFFGSDLKIRLADRVRYPDGIVVCTKVDQASKWVTDPVVIFGVLSQSTAHVDLGAKNREYEAAPSVQRYVVLHQDAVAATQFARVGNDWVGHILKSDAVLDMPEIGVTLPLLDLYADLELLSEAPSAAHEETRPLHLEPSHHAPGDWREFLRQYAMIVLSILTALGLERVAVGVHDRSAARASRIQIEAELGRDAADLASSEQANRDSIKQMRVALKAIVAQIKASPSGQARLDPAVVLALKGFSISTPSWETQAWESAISDQSVNHMDPAELSRYRAIYLAGRDFDEMVRLLSGGEWVTRATELELDAQIGPLDARQAASVLARILLILEQATAGEEKLSALLTGAPAAPISPR